MTTPAQHPLPYLLDDFNMTSPIPPPPSQHHLLPCETRESTEKNQQRELEKESDIFEHEFIS